MRLRRRREVVVTTLHPAQRSYRVRPRRAFSLMKIATPKPNYRRVVTANEQGKSVVRSDGEVETYEFKSVPGYGHTLI